MKNIMQLPQTLYLARYPQGRLLGSVTVHSKPDATRKLHTLLYSAYNETVQRYMLTLEDDRLPAIVWLHLALGWYPTPSSKTPH
jgi:hypothetical protein